MPLKISAKIGYSHYSFLIDTGSVISTIPYDPELKPLLKPTAVSLTNASGHPIKTYGEISVQLDIKLIHRSFQWSFVVSDVANPILGVDFLADHSLLIDCKNRTLIDSVTNYKIVLEPSTIATSTFSINSHQFEPKVQSILNKYPVLTSPLQLNNVPATASPITEHHIDTKAKPPVHYKARPLAGVKLEAAKQEVQFLLNAGIIRRSNSPWASPLHLVPKKEPGKWRPCGDYRSLNSITTDDKYPLPHLRSITMALHGKNIYSKLDLLRAYLQIPMAPEDIPKTAICTPFGLFEYLYMPYGLKNAGATFQRFIDTILANVPNVFIYLDDILIASGNEEQHAADIDNVLSILAQYNLRISINKCEFFKDSLNYLGYQISKTGIRPPPERVEVIQNWPLPETSTQLRQFMGMMNFFRQMIPNFANIAVPVTEMLRCNPKSKSLSWSDEQTESFQKLKQSLASCPTLSYPSPLSTEYQLVTDSSSYAVGAALYQMVDCNPSPVSFFSKKLSGNQKTYHTYDRELLAAYLAVIQFRTLIDGQTCYLFTDHKPLVSAFYSKTPSKSERQQRYISYLSEYISSMYFIKGTHNITADCLSRPINAVTVDIFDLHGIARCQENDEETQSFAERLTPIDLTNNLVLLCDTSTSVPRPFVPSSLREDVILSLHNLSHPGVKGTSKLIKHRYFWPSMDATIKPLVTNCLQCQQAKIHRHTKSPIEPISAPTDRFETVHIDIVGPLPTASHPDTPYPLPFRYILTCIDRATRWPEAIPLTDITASSVALAFTSGWVSRFGVPLNVVTDRGTQFESELFKELSQTLGFLKFRTTSYHPQSNGIVERMHRTLKAAIIARGLNWHVSLPIVLLGIRMSFNSADFTPFTAVTGSHMLCPRPMLNSDPIDTSSETVKRFVSEMRSIDFPSLSAGVCHPSSSSSSSTSYVPPQLKSCSHVWMRVDRVRKSLEAPYTGPYLVLDRYPKFFRLELPQGVTSVSIDRLKPAYIRTLEPPSQTENPPTPLSDPPVPPSDPPAVIPPQDTSPVDPTPPNTSAPTAPSSPSVKSATAPSHVTTRSGRVVKFNSKPDYVYFDANSPVHSILGRVVL